MGKSHERRVKSNRKEWNMELVPWPIKKNVIGAKWIFINKLDEAGKVTWKKARLVCKGYAQLEGINYGETYAPVARIEDVR